MILYSRIGHLGLESKDLKKMALRSNARRLEITKIKNKVCKSQKTEILFIEYCIEFSETSKMAIVLPDGILNNSKQPTMIMETGQVLSIVSLPQITFYYYGAGIKSSILFALNKAIKNR